MKQRLREFIQSLVDSCPQEGYIPFEEYTFQENVKTHLLDLCDLQPEDIEVFLNTTPFLETLKKLSGEHLLRLSPRTLLWLVEVERGLKLLREMLKYNQDVLPAPLQQ